jgi:beta-mannosidase
MPFRRLIRVAWCAAFVVPLVSLSYAEEAKLPVRKAGGFCCVNLAPLRNDKTFDLYQVGEWSRASFAMDIWKRHGVPFWYPREAGDVCAAGNRWPPATLIYPSSAETGSVAKADAQQPGNGAVANANDDDLSTYWYSGDHRPFGSLSIEFPAVERISSVRFLGWPTGRHAPKDYRVGLLMADGKRREIASVKDEKRMGQWLCFPVETTPAKGVYLEVTATVDNEHGPVIYELQARDSQLRVRPSKQKMPSQVVVPLNGVAGEELFVLGNVGAGFDPQAKAGATLGQYIVTYESGHQETIPLVAGKNVAHLRYGHFVPEAEVAFALPDRPEPDSRGLIGLNYHLDEFVAVEPKKQLMMFGHRLSRPGQRLLSLTLRVTDPDAALYLAALTVRQSGPRMNALAYQGKVIRPYPIDAPKAAPSPLAALEAPSRRISLNGRWRFRADPGNLGVREKYFAAEHDASGWSRMPIPSQWYVEGLDYHGVVWFRHEFDVPAAFPGEVFELCFGAVDYDARVWLNGQYVGRHIGAYASFKLDATAQLRKGARNVLVVRVDSPLDPGFTMQKTILKGNSMDDIAMPYAEEGCMGGIYRAVTLEGRGDVGIEEAWSQSTVSRDLKRADVTVRCVLQSKYPKAEELVVRCRLTESDGRKTHHAELRWATTSTGRTAAELIIPIDRPKLWYPWEQGEPYLYTMEIEVFRSGRLLDRHLSRIGIREIAFDEKTHCVHVNHHRIFLKGMLNDDVHWMSLMDRTGYRQRIQLQRDANLNAIRIVTHQSSPDMYDLCNEMGIMVWQEMPLQWAYSTSEPIRKDIERVVRETVVQCRPHPCVVGYSAWNEGGQGEFSEQLVAQMRALDATRPISRACGGGDWDIHIYPNLASNLSRFTPLWSGVKVGFASEVGAYGLPSIEEMHAIVGPNLFPFDSAEYYWETFNSYRTCDGPIFLDAPGAADWPTEKILRYMLDRQPASGRWLSQFMKFMYENFRGQRFAPTTAAIHCRFDDPFPSAFLGVVNFTGRPRKAYDAVREACQPVLPILFFDYSGAEDVRVVNEYWHRSWNGCTLRYLLSTRDGRPITRMERKFDLPADSTVKVLTRQEAGDVWHLPGFLADLYVIGPNGEVLATNHYDMTGEEIHNFVTTVYPVPPVEPVDSQIIAACDAIEMSGVSRRLDAQGVYSKKLLSLGGQGTNPLLKYAPELQRDGDYLVRVACNSGETLRSYELFVDGNKAALENYPYINMNLGLTRLPYSEHGMSWIPGWKVHLAKGRHTLELRWPAGRPAPGFIVDAICLQRDAWARTARDGTLPPTESPH